MKNKINQQLLCDYLFNKNLISTELKNEQLKIAFKKDESKNLLYSKLFYNGYQLDFIYKLSKEIENCKKIEELKNKK